MNKQTLKKKNDSTRTYFFGIFEIFATKQNGLFDFFAEK